MKSKSLAFFSLTAALACMAQGASLTEPATIFYGQVTNKNASGEILHEGDLIWTIAGASGAPTELHGSLAAHDEGRLSYVIEVPHSALVTGLETAVGTVPLGTQKAGYQHLSITVDGLPATIEIPGDYYFDLAAASRASTYRLDLSVSLPVSDTDGDGMPDWWEELHGLDPDSDDSAFDPDGDGLSNIEEFRRGTGPGTDNRGPELLTSGLVAYAGATTGVMLRTADLNSAPEELIYTLLEQPSHGELRMREGSALAVGDTFSQADVEGGRLVFAHEMAAPTAPTDFRLRVQDGTASADGEIEIAFFDPQGTSAPERGRMMADLHLGRDLGYVVWDVADASHAVLLSQPEDGRSVTITGGSGADVLSGGTAPDTIRGGAGDDRLTGLSGADRFVFLAPVDGDDQITDFDPAEGDVLDFTAALRGVSTLLTDYIQITGGSTIGVDANGDGSGFTDMIVTLEGHSLDLEQLYALVMDGNISAGALGLQPLVSVEATVAIASETGPNAGEFTIRRMGALLQPLSVAVQISGSATNGVDYAFLPGTVTIPAGASSVIVKVSPFPDNIAEVSEAVELRILDSATYLTGSQNVAQVSIENLKPQIRLEALLPVAAVSGGQRGMFLISRDGDVASSVLLRLEIGGTARSGSDYDALPIFLALAPQQTFALLEVIPNPGAQVSGGAESVTLSLLPNATYAGAEPTTAEVVIVPKLLRFDDWLADQFPGSDGDLDAAGVPYLLLYGLGIDPNGHVPTVGQSDGFLTLRYSEQVAATDLEYSVEVSSDLASWRIALPSEIRRVAAEESTPLQRVYRSARPLGDDLFRYMRVKVSRR